MKKRILIVDDERDFTSLLKLSLESMGEYEVQEENDSVNAVEAARYFDPDLFILDVMMPDIDGSDLAARLRSDPRFADTPIIFMTALLLGDEASSANPASGKQVYLPKSTPIEKVIECIEERTNGVSEVAS